MLRAALDNLTAICKWGDSPYAQYPAEIFYLVGITRKSLK